MVSFLFGEFHREHSLGEEKEWGNNREKKKKKFAQGAQSSNPFIQPCQNLKAYFCSPFFFPFLFLLSCINLPRFSQIFEVNGEF